MGACSKCECLGYHKKKKKKPGAMARRCRECAHLKSYHNVPEPEPSSEESSEDEPADPATTASEATTSVVVAPAASQVAESTPPTVATSIAQPSAPIVATILNRYLAKSSASSNTPSSSSSSLAATSSQSVPGPSTLASVPLPALSSAEAIGGWRKQQLDRKKLADTNTQASRTKGKAKVKGKEREKVRKIGWLAVFADGLEWDPADTSLPVPTVVYNVTMAEIQNLAQQGHAVFGDDGSLFFTSSMTADDVLDWVFDKLPNIRQLCQENADRFADDRGPLVLLQKSRNKLLLYRQAFPTGGDLERTLAGADQAWQRNGIFMTLSFPLSADEPAVTYPHTAETIANSDYGPPEEDYRSWSLGRHERSPSSSPPLRRSKRKRTTSATTTGATVHSPLFIEDSDDEPVPIASNTTSATRPATPENPDHADSELRAQHDPSPTKIDDSWMNEFLG